ncbi:MAG: PrsW family intramembrane metalloprotease [Thermoplasmatales archaeon]|nr:MAG: PrsW family intramembrane metalloprotease [Thermoplasmatales archaeon]
MELLLLFIVAFLPPIIYVIWIRNTEKYNREKWKPIIFCFIWGATIAVAAALILEVFLSISIAVSIEDSNMFTLIAIIIIAPFAEELTKPLALRLKIIKRELSELEDGLVYGAVAGLGFSATENLFYGSSFMSEGLIVFFVLMILRSFGGCLLHASATSWTGYGYGKTIMKHTSLIRVLPYFLLAILVHAFYNFLLSFDMKLGVVTGLFAAFGFVALTIYFVRNKIRTLDQMND